jgi:hypothetical protein
METDMATTAPSRLDVGSAVWIVVVAVVLVLLAAMTIYLR